MPRLIDADKLKQHYAWWENGTAEMTLDETKKTFDTIIDVQPTVDIDAITESHEKIGYDKGFRDGYAQATVDAVEVVRCKDCRKWCICHHSDDYYCADGERKEDAETD